MTSFASVTPTVGDSGNTFEWLLDINIGTLENPVWVNIPDMTGFDPKATPTKKDGTVYAHKGSKSNTKVGEEVAIAVQVKGVKDRTGEFQPELVALIIAADSVGEGNVIGYRYYHASSRVLAYQGTVAVEWNRANTDNDSLEFFAFTLEGQGDRVRITNPTAGAAVPSINSATPSGRAAGDVVIVLGARFTGITTVTVGGVPVVGPEVLSDGILSVKLPAGSAGSAPIIATTPAGASAPFPYKRA